METKINFYPGLEKYIGEVISGFETISDDRKKELEALADYIKKRVQSGEPALLNFICTHNSRRSHLSQIWAATAAAFYGIKGVKSYSGGTEATAFNPRAVAALERAGFTVQNSGGNNPLYKVSYSSDAPAMECYSKKYDDPVNPQDDFVAVMTCSEADKDCPFIPGAALRAPIRYKDPKEADDTLQEQERYDERCRQIATEMFYMISLVNQTRKNDRQI